MAFLGNSDASGSGGGVAVYSLTADITGMGATQMANQKIGERAQSQENGKNFVLILTGGVRSWVQQD